MSTLQQQPPVESAVPPPPAATESPAEDHDDLQSDDGSGDVLGALDFAFDAHALEAKDVGGPTDGANKNVADNANATDKGLVSSIDWSSFQQQVSTTALSPPQTQLRQQQQQQQTSTHFASLHGPSVSGLMVGGAGSNNDGSALLPGLAGQPESHSSHESGKAAGDGDRPIKASPSPGADKLVRSTDSGSQRKSPNVPLRSRNVYVAALPINFSEADLTALLSDFGKVKSCRMFNSGARVNDIGRAYGFALFEEPGSAERAVAALDGKPLGNARIQCQLSRNGVVKKPKDVRERARITMANKEAVNTTSSKSPAVSAFLSQSQDQPQQQQPSSNNNTNSPSTTGGTAPTAHQPMPANPMPGPQQTLQQPHATTAGPPPMLPHPGQLTFNSFIAAPPQQQHQQYQQPGQHQHHGMYMGQQGMMPPPFPNQSAAGHQHHHQFYAPQQQQHQPQLAPGMQMQHYMGSAQQAPPPTGGAVPVMTPQGIVWMRAA